MATKMIPARDTWKCLLLEFAVILAAQIHCASARVSARWAFVKQCVHVLAQHRDVQGQVHTRLGRTCLYLNYTQQLGKYFLYENTLCLPLIFH